MARPKAYHISLTDDDLKGLRAVTDTPPPVSYPYTL